ncbi:MAG: 4Fe-4S binding protein [Oligoflexia bacterium]|nr:4Fe-4S binding protein [Oligoflexia bacterium]
MWAPMLSKLIAAVFKKPFTIRYPFEKKELAALHRGHISIEIKKCIYCGMCQKKCPTAAIAVSRPEKSWSIDRLFCITCNSCVEVCPTKCLTMETSWSPTQDKRGIDLFKGEIKGDVKGEEKNTI